MRWRTVFVAGLMAIVAAAPAQARRTSRVRPHAFRSCTQLVRYGRAHFAATKGVPEPAVGGVGTTVTTGSGAVPPSAAPTVGGGSAGGTFSTTNTQEPGVDEPDLDKTDGSTLFAIEDGKVHAVAVGSGAPQVLDSLTLPNGTSQLLLHGTRLIAITASAGVPIGPARPAPAAAIAPIPYPYNPRTTVTEIDVSNPSAMKVTRTMTIDGSFVDARQNGATARLVISSSPRAVSDAKLRTRTAGWVPARRFHSNLTGRHYVRRVAGCRAIAHPAQFSGLGMLTILTIDLDRGLYAADSDALMADAQVVYGSTDALYVATQKWIDPNTPVTRVPAEQDTVIHQFDVGDPDRTTFVASGEVPGYLLNQFSLSEYEGHLRVATTSRPIWWTDGPPPTSQSQVTVLKRAGSTLNRVGGVSGLGKGQQIYSVRFVEDAGYVVTFRQVDPLYTLDLSSPTNPKVAGQLELEGYSSYLQPVGDGLLLGIGQAVGGGNEPTGTQVELFGVSDPSSPKLLGRVVLASASSAAQFDHHAFLYWPATGLAVLPVDIYAPVGGGGTNATRADSVASGFDGAIGYHVSPSGISEVGRVSHDAVNGSAPPIDRALVNGSHLLTVSSEGVMASNLSTLAREAFAAF